MERQNHLLQQRLLRSQMNPHFTFNTLNLIKNEVGRDVKKSSQYIIKFSRMLRSIFENSTKDYVLVEDEMQLLSDYMDMQQFRFPGRFEYEIHNDIPEDSEIAIPPMLLQPFVENAIIHGFKGIEGKGIISITLSIGSRFINCIIEDNGRGFDRSKLKPESSVQLIDKFLKKITGHGVIIKNKIEGDQKETGVLINLNIPFQISIE